MGVGAVPKKTNRWTSIVANKLEVREINFGIGSSCLTGRPLGARSLQDTLSNIPFPKKDLEFIIISYGLNDIGSMESNYDTVLFKRTYRKSLNLIKQHAWRMDKVILLSPYYISEAGYKKYDSLNPTHRMPTVSRHLDFVAAVLAISKEQGTRYINIYDSMKLYGAERLLSADSLHPNNAGHAVIARCVINHINSLSTNKSKHKRVV
jgi:lysophospholipase L1-like esterase